MSANEITQAIEDTVPDRPMLTREQVAEISGFTVQTLASLALKKQGPAFTKLGRAVRYPRGAVVQWLTQRAVATSNV